VYGVEVSEGIPPDDPCRDGVVGDLIMPSGGWRQWLAHFHFHFSFSFSFSFSFRFHRINRRWFRLGL
jgi:hypothetical protein